MRPPETTRILIVEDSRLVARVISDTLSTLPSVEVVGVAATGGDALRLIDQLEPDLISLDLELPDMSGLDLLSTIMERRRRKVVVVSSHTQDRATTTFRALDLGAIDVVAKAPSGELGGDIATNLLRTFRAAIVARPQQGVASPAGPANAAHNDMAGLRLRRPEIMIIAASTGGPVALTDFFGEFDQPLPWPTVVVQHLPSGFPESLAARLDAAGPFEVRVPGTLDAISKADIWLAPGGHQLRMTRTRFTVQPARQGDGLAPRADLTLTSAAASFGPGALAIILTGMGDDGLAGSQRIVAAGGQVLAQSGESSLIDGMPSQVRRAGLSLGSGSPRELAQLIRTTARSTKTSETLESTRTS